MKKIIESDLISIAHRILKLKDKSEISSLLKETELLHNKLILLQFYEDNKFRLDPSITPEKLLEDVKSTEPTNEQPASVFLTEEKKDDVVTFEEELITPIELSVTNAADIDAAPPVEASVENVEEEKEIEETTEEVVEEISPEEEVQTESNVVEFTPSIEETIKSIDEVEEEIKIVEQLDPVEDAKEAVERATLEIDPVFSIPHNELFDTNDSNKKEEDTFKGSQHFVTNQAAEKSTENYRQIPLNKSINDAFANKISIGLNDRIAFEKNLFNGSSDDLNRVIAQLNTIESYEEAKDFIDDLVKPEFNNWNGKEDYENRFMQLVEKRFL
ncbi:hypothetical protein SAMN05421741_11917 [Paenimyroides ummariense]|uniref:Uncharacterized protein n=1 Tax=Paenimyroides ummariense TaxID=913024 RepID=A0A1I5E7J2_9FLAO|nr:hypothetical protein [Paenimyroides ummariense]SFO07306.1 hypothetical protein SAMN05421741_11917 [Paenimyroides ummariense]